MSHVSSAGLGTYIGVGWGGVQWVLFPVVGPDIVCII